ncbi:hypothetical protein Vadar_031202 [Vaccinium darrowii]|uniref:Uncharacterized protein n=1 Tax=Vaccinium darrowii TaxID=229202 RepID=A0ACB7ZQ63_9ERIC|nr:hypothetical protein Vadar_031202 [Vaccinium darrowii]
MTIPAGFLFRPTDELLVTYYLERKFMGLPLPSDLIIEREIYGVGDKAPWQIFTDEDPWEICKTNGKNGNSSKSEGTIYVFIPLIKASKNRIARTAGCGVWHAETALENVLNDQGRVIGYKKMLCFQITNDRGVMDGSVSKGHWIMHEYSRCGGNTDESQVEYVLCRIKRHDSKFTKKSKRVKNLEATTTDHDDIAPKPAKRVRTEFVEEHKMVRDIDAATETEVMPFPEEVVVQEPSFTMSDDPNEFTVEEFLALWEQDRQGRHSPRMSDESNDLIAAELEALMEEEKQGSNQESDMFHAEEEPSPVFSLSNDFFLEQQKKDMFNDMFQLDHEALWWLENMSGQGIPTA